MYSYQDIRIVHLELTDKCNAACPMCIRNMFGSKPVGNVLNIQLSLEDIRTIFPPNFVSRLDEIYCCGNAGEPTLCTEILEILTYFRQCNSSIRLVVHTNGSTHDREWWHRLGTILSCPDDLMVFSIDGLEDTNHLYRRKTIWPKIITAIQAVVAAGGNTMWEFIPFKHNQHQIDQAKSLAQKLKMTYFQLKKTGRFIDFSDSDDMVLVWKNASPVYNEKTGELEYVIEPASKNLYKNVARENLDIKLRPHQFEKKISLDLPCNREQMTFDLDLNALDKEYASCNHQQINCLSQNLKEMFVSAEGFVFPCCWTAYNLYSYWLNGENMQIRNTINDFSLNNLSAKHWPLRTVIESDFFQKIIPGKWRISRIRDGRLIVCSQFCNTFDFESLEYDEKRECLTQNKRLYLFSLLQDWLANWKS